MRANTVLAAAAFLSLSPCATIAQPIHGITLDSVAGLYNVDTIYSDMPIVFFLRVTSITGTPELTTQLWNAFKVYSPTGAAWHATAAGYTGAFTPGMMDATNVHLGGTGGSGVDTVWFLAGAGGSTCGLPPDFDEVALTITIGPIDSQYVGQAICLDSTTFGVPAWWRLGQCDVVTGQVSPAWDGPHCFTVRKRPCVDPFTGNDLISGDASHDGHVNSADIITMVTYVFRGGEPDACWITGDANCTGTATSSDIIYLVNVVFKSGPAPCNVCSFVWNLPEVYCHSLGAR